MGGGTPAPRIPFPDVDVLTFGLKEDSVPRC
jgi:hypothetical protein